MNIQKNNLIGKTIGNFTILDVKNQKYYYKDKKKSSHVPKCICKCICGNVSEYYKQQIIKGSPFSCGCLSRPAKFGKDNSRWTGVGDISGKFFSELRKEARKRDKEFLLTKQYLWNLFLQQSRRCAISGVDLEFTESYTFNFIEQTASLDRIDSSKGYIEGNVQWVHKMVNFMKNILSMDQFLKWINIIYLNNKKIIDNYKVSTNPILSSYSLDLFF